MKFNVSQAKSVYGPAGNSTVPPQVVVPSNPQRPHLIVNKAIILKDMPEYSPELGPEFLKQRAATLREALGAMPMSISDQLLKVAEELETRAARLKRVASEKAA